MCHALRVMNDTSTLTTGDAAKVAGNSPATIRSWVLKGILRADRTAGGVRLIRLADLQAVLAARQTRRA